MYHSKSCACFTVTGMKVLVEYLTSIGACDPKSTINYDVITLWLSFAFGSCDINHKELNMVSKAGRCAFVFNVISQCTSKGFQNKYKSCGGNLNLNAKPQGRKKKVITSFFHACIFLSFLHHHDCSACAEWWGGVHVK